MSVGGDVCMNDSIAPSAFSRIMTAVLIAAVVFGVFSFFRLVVDHIFTRSLIAPIIGFEPETARMLSFFLAGVAGIATQFLLERGREDTLKACFALNLPRVGTFVIWGLIGIVFGVAYDMVSRITGKNMAPDHLVVCWQVSPMVFLLTFVMIMPVFEELFFRGLLFRHLTLAFPRYFVPALITSSMWAALHHQYGGTDVGVVFLLGMLLAFARMQTQSIFVCVEIHILLNLMTTVETALVV